MNFIGLTSRLVLWAPALTAGLWTASQDPTLPDDIDFLQDGIDGGDHSKVALAALGMAVGGGVSARTWEGAIARAARKWPLISRHPLGPAHQGKTFLIFNYGVFVLKQVLPNSLSLRKRSPREIVQTIVKASEQLRHAGLPIPESRTVLLRGEWVLMQTRAEGKTWSQLTSPEAKVRAREAFVALRSRAAHVLTQSNVPNTQSHRMASQGVMINGSFNDVPRGLLFSDKGEVVAWVNPVTLLYKQ